MPESNRIPNLTAMVIGFNEGQLLEGCLKSIFFCETIKYFDLGSDDDSTQIANDCGAEVTITQRAPLSEQVRARHIDSVDSDWVLITDPDERVDPLLSSRLLSEWQNLSRNNKLGGIRVPIQFYFKSKPLKGTPWGGKNSRLLILRKQAFDFTETVHKGEQLKVGYDIQSLTSDNEVVHHYWSNSYRSLIKKHLKYLKYESKKYDPENPVKLWLVAVSPLIEFGRSYVFRRGYRDGINGFFLSIVWSWYNTSARYTQWRNMKRNRSFF